jgi:hypothetical protein
VSIQQPSTNSTAKPTASTQLIASPIGQSDFGCSMSSNRALTELNRLAAETSWRDC